MTPKLKAELRLLRKRRFYYIGRTLPEYMWRDREGKTYNMHDMGLDHLKACICLITKDMEFLRSSLLVSPEASTLLKNQAHIKREELRQRFKEKSAE
ncbi:hypothetical protein HF563_00745 [Acidithiobacillus ferridurans]|nr:hypothetical protein [Acidithiobacillus ferridurans]